MISVEREIDRLECQLAGDQPPTGDFGMRERSSRPPRVQVDHGVFQSPVSVPARHRAAAGVAVERDVADLREVEVLLRCGSPICGPSYSACVKVDVWMWSGTSGRSGGHPA